MSDEDDRPTLPEPARWARAMKEVRAVYRHADRAYAPFSCPASSECCQLAVTKRQPWLWEPEWRVLLDAVSRQQLEVTPRADGGCPLLDAEGKRCRVYADRPLGCRTYFCQRVRGPSREPMEEMTTLSRRLEHLSTDLDEAAAPRPLLDWIDAWWNAGGR